jgi:hypothetical protein
VSFDPRSRQDLLLHERRQGGVHLKCRSVHVSALDGGLSQRPAA